MSVRTSTRTFFGLGTVAPSDRSATLVNVLVAGFLVLAVTGAAEATFVTDPGALLQSVASLALAGWGLVMRMRGRPRPVPILVVSTVAAVAYLVAGAVDPSFADVTDTSPVVIVVGAGVIALAAGSVRPGRLVVFSLVMTAAATITVQWAIGATTGEIIVDTVTAMIVMAITFGLVRTIRSTADTVEARFRGLIESAPVAVVDVDLRAWTEGAETVHMGPMNPAAAAILGYPESVAEVRLQRSEIPHTFGVMLDEVARTGTGSTIITFRRSGRVMKVGWRVDPTTGRVVLSGTDITAQRRAEDELSGKVTARDRFIASVSHELRTPLAGALGLLEIVADGDEDDPERPEMIRLALEQVRDMVDIVEDLLVAARAAGGQLTVHASPVDLGDTVARVLAVTPEPFGLDTVPEAWVTGDPVRIRQILKNLVTNAVRYGGAERRVVVRGEGASNIVEVRDSGAPLDREFADAMFQPYERASADNADSVGLGLAVARTLAELMGGTLSYDYDGEVVFRLSLPACHPSEPTPN